MRGFISRHHHDAWANKTRTVNAPHASSSNAAYVIRIKRQVITTASSRMICGACKLKENQPPPPKAPASAFIQPSSCHRYQAKDQYPTKKDSGYSYKLCMECAGPYKYPSRPNVPSFFRDMPYQYTPSYNITASPSESSVLSV